MSIEPKLVQNLLAAKITISQNKSSHLSPAEFLPIIYACPLGLSLATNLQQSPPIIMEQLGSLLSSKDDSNLEQGQLLTEIVPLGWINFYLDAKLIAEWLERSLFWSQSNVITDRTIYPLDQTPPQLFPMQYIHARCCSLLRLAARENLITFTANLEQIKQPQSICWLDPEHNLWLTEVAEHNLLQQLLIVSDAWLENTHVRRWSKLALSLSQNTAIFLADCRFLGEVKQRYPQKAIARLGLIALVQFWLEKILVEKLRVAAPREL
jgi:arginyl-tRNA synthetase